MILVNILLMICLFGAFLVLLWMILKYFGGKLGLDAELARIIFGLVALIVFVYIVYYYPPHTFRLL